MLLNKKFMDSLLGDDNVLTIKKEFASLPRARD
jgi:hypothetical protein